MKNISGRPLKYGEPTEIVTLRMPVSLIRDIHTLSKIDKRKFSEEVIYWLQKRIDWYKRKGVL